MPPSNPTFRDLFKRNENMFKKSYTPTIIVALFIVAQTQINLNIHQ